MACALLLYLINTLVIHSYPTISLDISLGSYTVLIQPVYLTQRALEGCFRGHKKLQHCRPMVEINLPDMLRPQLRCAKDSISAFAKKEAVIFQPQQKEHLNTWIISWMIRSRSCIRAKKIKNLLLAPNPKAFSSPHTPKRRLTNLPGLDRSRWKGLAFCQNVESSSLRWSCYRSCFGPGRYQHQKWNLGTKQVPILQLIIHHDP